MTLDEFLSELSKKRGFQVLSSGAIRRSGECPLTAVCNRLTGSNLSLADYHVAGRELGLDFTLTSAIMHAADYRGQGQPSPLRFRLLAALNLTEIEQKPNEQPSS